jgi:hypothetical protein
MIRLNASLVEDLNHKPDGLRRALRQAPELEHSTIPPCLYALYSIKPGAIPEIAGL